jgi:phage portal protein BeeE
MFKFLANLWNKPVVEKSVPSTIWRPIHGFSTTTDSLSNIVPNLSQEDLLEKAKFHSIVFALTRAISDAILSAPLVARIDNEDIELEQLDVLKYRLEYPLDEFLRLIICSHLTVGAGYAIKIKAHGSLASLAYVPAYCIEVIPSGRLFPAISGYKIDKVFYKPEDLFVIRSVDPSNPVANVSPLISAARDLHLDEQRLLYWIELLQNTPVPGVMLSAKDDNLLASSESVVDKLVNESGLGRRGGAVFLPTPMDVHNIGEGFGDSFDWAAFVLNVEARLCSAFGVPPQLIAVEAGLKYSTYSNYEEARKSFMTNTIKPKWRSLGQALTRSLCVDEGDVGVELCFDLSNIAELEDHADEVELLNASIITTDEARERLGFEAKENGENDTR